MATVDELIEQYETDEALQKEVAEIVADGKIERGRRNSGGRQDHDHGVHAFREKARCESLIGGSAQV